MNSAGRNVEEEAKNKKVWSLDSLPLGYRFKPKDGELIVHYLRKKLRNQPLPMVKIVEINLYDHDPDLLAARYRPLGMDEWFYFTPRDKTYMNGQRPNRKVGGPNKTKDQNEMVGYWSATGSDKEIMYKDEIVGYRKTLVFKRGKPKTGVKTNWIMHEFTVVDPPEPQDTTRLDDYVLCKIYRNQERSRKDERVTGESNQSSPKTSIAVFNRNGFINVDDKLYDDQYHPSTDGHHHQPLRDLQPIFQLMGQHPFFQMGHHSIVQMDHHPIHQTSQHSILQMEQQPIHQTSQHSIVQMAIHPILQTSQHSILQMDQQPIHQTGQHSIVQMDQQPIYQTSQQSIHQTSQQSIAQMGQKAIVQMGAINETDQISEYKGMNNFEDVAPTLMETREWEKSSYGRFCLGTLKPGFQ